MKELHLICNAHLDPVWQWDWNEGTSAALATFYSAVDIAEEYDYIFCHNEALLYEYVERFDPKLFARIKELVEAGKWHIMGGWYIQPDCNVPSGEGFVRQIETGLKYFKERFGMRPSVAVNFDSFGHTQGLVQILSKCGYEGYIRPDHGRHLWSEGPGNVRPGYGLYDRALGIMYMLGLRDSVEKFDKKQGEFI